ncbi:Vacuolar protein sorting-associated protein 51 [Tetrabaena socialis]|uniref:Vacuolar protein sorting-associated protein 51 homolog n=1 Tax=Tetrabaena socialis TaxID=47790 RepID=A0A2J8A8F8_9CHLO|nr:Vacuolar protein sorting-associated protein 51 [Tetrabaena socialis]|eukprot:PNH08814.1 Vacuolar protein sorting-associated protein 51 [Tetrabaena socialis]
MEGGEDYAKRSERVKALLSSYYGEGPATGPGPSPQPSGPSQHAPGGRVQAAHPGGLAAIDTPTFNADQHTSDILRIFSLEKLMVEHRNMAREIKNLDSDMQQLVYENYNKFITATDTIRTMKSSVDAMESEMQRLQETAGIVAEKSLSVSNKLQQRRESMEQLYKVQQLLRKLQTVFELPRKMRAALEEDALDTAVGLYAEAQPLLHKYGGRGTFKVIALESDFVAQEISQLLKKRLTERKDDAEQCVLLLRKLGEPDDTLQDKYLSGRVARIKRVLAEAAVVADAMAAAAGGQQSMPPPPKAQVAAPESWGWAGSTPPPLRAFVRALDEKFINGVQETVVNVIRFFLPEGSEDSPEAAAAKRKPLVALSRDLFAEYFTVVRRVVTDAAKAGVLRGSLLREARAEAAGGGGQALSVSSPALQQLGSDWGAEPIAQALSTVSTDVGLLAAHLPELQLKEHAMEVVQAAVQQHVTLSFAALKQRVIDAAAAVRTALGAEGGPGDGGGGAGGGGPGSTLRAGSAYLVELLQRGLAALLQGLRGYESAGGSRLLASWRDSWVDVVQGGLQQFFAGLLTASLELAALRYDGDDLLREAFKAGGAGGGALAGGSGGHDLMGPPAGAVAGAGAQELVKPGLVLLLAKLCKFLEQVMVPWVMETVAASFASGGGGGGPGAGGGDLPPSFVPGEVARRLSAASSAMVLAFVEMHGRQLSVMVRRSTASVSWLTCKEPRGPRPVCSLLSERLARVEAEAGGLLDEPGLAGGAGGRKGGPPGDDHRDPGSGGAGSGMYGSSNAYGGGDSGAVERNVAKLFREKVHMTGSVPLSCPAILAAIASVALKSLLESIRLETLGRAGLQQLQLDVAFLRPALRRFLLRGGGGKGDGAAVVEQLLEDVVLSGAERCVEPQLLEAAVVERILANASSER